MSEPTHTAQPDPDPARGGHGARAKIAKATAAVAAVAALVFGANAITKSDASSASGTGTRSMQTAPAGRPGTGAPPGMGNAVTGATLTRLKAVVAARYPGTVEKAMRLPDGSYVVHVIQSGGEVHVAVSKDFEVTGAQQGGPPGGGAPPAGGSAPGGTTSSTPS